MSTHELSWALMSTFGTQEHWRVPWALLNAYVGSGRHAHELIWGLMRTQKCSWVLKSDHKCKWSHSTTLKSTHVHSWALMNSHENSWTWHHKNESTYGHSGALISMAPCHHEQLWAIMPLHQNTHECSWVLINAPECSFAIRSAQDWSWSIQQ